MKNYSSYKDSGVEWIGEIPEHWIKSKVKFSMMNDGFRSGPFGSSLITNQLLDEGNYLVYTPEHVVGKKIDFPLFVPEEREEELSKYLVKRGDIIIPIVGTLGRGKIITDKDPIGILNQRLCRITPNEDKINLDLLLLLLTESKVVKTQFDLEKKGSILDHITKEILFNLTIPLPPINEQQKIVEFLDDKTTKIDNLIQHKEKKIELLKEKRTSLINHVVTKGLNPDVEYKDSGVEWVGKIPSHWSTEKLKYVSNVLPSNVDKHIYPDEIQVRLCNYTDVYYNEYITKDIELKKGSCNDNEYQKFSLLKGDVIITKDSESPDDIGVPTFVKDSLENVVCGYHLTMIRPVSVLGGFIFRFIQSDRTSRYFEVNSSGVTRYGLGKSSIENLVLSVPPKNEQEQIINYLDEQTKEIDDLIQLEQKKIELLKEYRQSLISEVVTGKVRICEEDVV